MTVIVQYTEESDGEEPGQPLLTGLKHELCRQTEYLCTVGLISTGLAALSTSRSRAALSNVLVLPFVFQQVVEHQGAETESLSPSHSSPRSQLSKGN